MAGHATMETIVKVEISDEDRKQLDELNANINRLLERKPAEPIMIVVKHPRAGVREVREIIRKDIHTAFDGKPHPPIFVIPSAMSIDILPASQDDLAYRQVFDESADEPTIMEKPK